ncbi:sensor histidine kinase [Hymenobacter chitinivorans]|uniref:Oxygen sensor histidine kinase NreB n=1 Tax=Hymenobacter chitinivorans DSM 11115 TaxID=1121954 RepID=A0A2M9APX7_9BACT|nr:two-component regulator propeller domain-containing protein [Hymenobacter chitinivorans]PJJ47754.1 ligand-binding sensor domain-containing protein [Hymenobacter chitinivorans DSM 11115]
MTNLLAAWRRLGLLGLLVSLAVVARAQTSSALTFHTLTAAQGLSENSVYSIVQDRRGFLWFGTQDGLSRYDGVEFRVFRNDPQRSGSLSSNFILSLTEDQQGQLWVGTGGGGLCRYNHVTGRFRSFEYEPTDENGLADNFVRVVYCDRQGRVWAGTEGGLHRFEPRKNHFQRFVHAASLPENLRRNSVRAITQSATGTLWVGTGEGRISRLNPATGYLEADPRWAPTSAITALQPDKQGGLWVGTETDGLWYVPATGPRQGIGQRVAAGPGEAIRALFLDQQQHVWIGTNKGLVRYQPVAHTFTTYQHQSGVVHSLPDNVVLSVFQDRSGLLWTGTEGGISSFEAQPSAFAAYPGLAGRPNGPVWAVAEDAAGTVWVGTESLGLVSYNPATGQRREFRHHPQDPGSLSEDFVRALCFDRQGRLWVGTQSQGLDCLEPGATRFRHYRHDPAVKNTISEDFIRTIYEGPDGRLWVGTEGGLNRFEPDKDGFTSFRNDPANPRSLSNNFVRVVHQDRTGRVWVGTGGGGLCCYNPVTGQFSAFRTDDRNPRSLSSNFVRSILEDHAGQLWVGTEGGGLCRLDDARRGIFTTFREPQGLPNDVVYGVLEDAQQHLWLSTNKGLARFTPANNQFYTFDTRDGLPFDEFNAGGYYASPSGRLYFGGVQGLVSFQPGAVRTNAVPPPVVLTGFRKFNQPVELDTSITVRRRIVLGPQDYFFSVEFAALNFRLPEKNRYAYMLENFDPDWVQAGTKREATYTNLDPGTYTFRVRATNNDGIWNPRGTALTIVVQPHWYGTWWFRILISWVLFGLLFLAYRLRVRQLLALERVRHNIARDLHDDMGSTLSSISILSQIARTHQHNQRTDQATALLDQIGDSSRRMLDAMDDIVWTINPAHDSMDDVVARMRSFASDVLEARGIDFTFRADPSIAGLRLNMRARREFFLLFKEAVNNLAKYAQCTEAAITLAYEHQRLVLTVQDDGVGFDPQAPAQGGGNGLTNMNSRAAAMKGVLDIQTAPGQGTVLRLNVPLKS